MIIKSDKLASFTVLFLLMGLFSCAQAPTLLAQINIGSGGFNSTNVCPSTSVSAGCQVATNADAMLSGTYLQLTNGVKNQVGSAWTVAPQTVVNGFSTNFTFQFTNPSNPPADGIAFVIQNAPSGLAAIGYKGTGGAIGYGDDDFNLFPHTAIQNSLAIEFDSFRDILWDPNSNHVAVQSCGTGYNTSHHNQPCSWTNSGSTFGNSTLGISTSVGALPITLSDGNVHTVTIQYNPPGTPCNTAASASNNLCIYLDQATYPNPVVTVNVNLSTVLSLGTGGTAYVGLTGATGSNYETQDIQSWTFAATIVQPFSTTAPTTANFTTNNNENALTLNLSNANGNLLCNTTATPGQATPCPSTGIELVTTNMPVSTADWEQYVIGTPWDGSLCAARPANGANTCSLFVNACYGGNGNISAADASDFYCPFVSPTAPQGTSITIEDVFDPPSPKLSVNPGTTVSLLDFTPSSGPTEVWAPAGPGQTPNPVCTSPFEPSFQCDVADTLVQVYGDQTTTKGSKPKKGWVVTVFNVAMLSTLWQIVSCPTSAIPPSTGLPAKLNNPPSNTNNASSTEWFNGSCLIQPTVSPATPPAGFPDFQAAPPAFLFYGIAPASDTTPIVSPLPSDTFVSNSSLSSAAPWSPNSVTLNTLINNGGDGTYSLHWSGQDLVGNSEKNVVLNTSGTGICPNPTTNVNDNAPCYTTNLFTTTLNIDNTAPTVVSATFSSGGSPVPSPFTFGQQVYPVYTCSDNLSGVFACGDSGTPAPSPSCPLTTAALTSTTPINTQNAGPQSYMVTATDCAGNVSAPFTVSYTVSQASQTITFTMNAPSTAVYNSNFTVAATGGASGNSVVFTSAGACSNMGATYTLTSGTGTCSVIANQAGNTNYSAAPQVTQTVNASLAAQTITFGALPNRVYGSGSFAVSATASSGLPVSFTSTTVAVCTVSGSTVALVAGGACTIQATQIGNGNYAAAAPVMQSFTVTPANQTITFTMNAPGSAGENTNFTVAASAPGGTVLFTSSGACTNSGATYTTSSSAGTCSVIANQAGNGNYSPAPTVTQSVSVTAPSVTVTPAVVTFPTTKAGRTATAQVTVNNTGLNTVTINSVVVVANNHDFTATSCPASLAVGASCVITVTYHADSDDHNGTTANLVITDNAPVPGSMQTVTLNGKSD